MDCQYHCTYTRHFISVIVKQTQHHRLEKKKDNLIFTKIAKYHIDIHDNAAEGTPKMYFVKTNVA